MWQACSLSLAFKSQPRMRLHTGLARVWFAVAGAAALPCSDPKGVGHVSMLQFDEHHAKFAGGISCCAIWSNRNRGQVWLLSVAFRGLDVGGCCIAVSAC